MMPFCPRFCHLHSTDIFIVACSHKETVKPTELKYSLKESLFMWNKTVFESNVYELAHRSYGLFSNDMQKHMKLMSVPW